MYWDRPQYFPKGTTSSSQPQVPPKNELVANRQQNSAGLWNGNQVTIGSTPLINPTATWASPVFDLRPDLPFLSQGENSSTPVYRSKTGDWGSLWVMVDGLNQAYPSGGLIYGFAGLKVEYGEIVSPIDPTLTRRVNDPINITAEFAVNPALVAGNTGQQSALLQFKPTSDVDPVRFWQVILYFSWQQTFTEAPNLRIQASYY